MLDPSTYNSTNTPSPAGNSNPSRLNDTTVLLPKLVVKPASPATPPNASSTVTLPVKRNWNPAIGVTELYATCNVSVGKGAQSVKSQTTSPFQQTLKPSPAHIPHWSIINVPPHVPEQSCIH